MRTLHRLANIVGMLVAALAATSPALAQCPNGLPQSAINSIQTPELRSAAAINTWLDPATIRQNGGLQNMIALSRKQIEADQATIAEEQRNQAYLAQNGMGNDARAADGRKVIQMLTESQRLTQAAIQVMECHARTGSMPGAAAVPVASTENVWNMSASERRASLVRHSQTATTVQPGTNFAEAMESLSRTLRQRAMVNASPEVAAFWARQDALYENGRANMAASEAGRRRGQQEAQRDSLNKQVEMVNDAVTSWQAPRHYSAPGAANAGAVEDPFAERPETNSANIRATLSTSGLIWDDTRRVARVGDAAMTLCGGRLKTGDYPVLADGSLLDTAARIQQFQSSCSDASSPLVVVRENGNIEVRK